MSSQPQTPTDIDVRSFFIFFFFKHDLKVQIHGNEPLVHNICKSSKNIPKSQATVKKEKATQLLHTMFFFKIRYCAAIHGKVLHRDCEVDGF